MLSVTLNIVNHVEQSTRVLHNLMRRQRFLLDASGSLLAHELLHYKQQGLHIYDEVTCLTNPQTQDLWYPLLSKKGWMA